MRVVAPVLGFALLAATFWFGIFTTNFTTTPTTGYSRDLYAQFFPRYVYAASVMWRGEMPLWNPYELCGLPFLATGQGVLNPFLVAIFGLVPQSLALHVYFLIHFFLSGLLTYVLCRRIGLGWQGAAVAGVAWAVSPALTRSVYHPGRIGSLLYLPVVFLLGERLRRSGSASTAVLLALALALELCGGYPEFALDTAVLLGIALLAGFGGESGSSARARPSRVAAAAALSAVLAIMLAGVQLLPLLELARESARSAVAARPLLAPGPAVLGTLFGLRREAGLAYGAMLPAFYVGASPLLLAVCAIALGAARLRGPIVACAMGCVLAVVGYRYLHLIPIYRSTRFPLPWSLLFPFFTAVLAGIGWEGLIAPGARERRAMLYGLLFTTSTAFVALGTRVSGAFAVLAAMIALRAVRAQGAILPAGLLLAVIVGDLFAQLPYFGGSDPFPPLPRAPTTHALLDAVRGRRDELRFLGAAESYEGLALTDRVRSIAGLEGSVMPQRTRRIVDHFNLAITPDMPLRLERVISSKPLLDLMGVAYLSGPARWGPALTRAGCVPVVEPSGAARGLWQNPAALPRAFLVRGVRVVGSASEAFAAVTSTDFRPGEEVVVEEPLGAPIPPGSVLPGEGARVLRDAAEELRIETTALQPAVLLVADSYFPGWEARVDDAAVRIARADFAFRAVTVPAGRHAVTFTYRPRAFRDGTRLSLAGLAVVAGVLASRVVARRRVRARCLPREG